MDIDKKKMAAIETVMNQIEKQYGKGSIVKLGSNKTLDIESIPTGSLALDIALGIGGVPKGRIIEIYGPESSGKTTISLSIIAEAQKLGGAAAFVDAEHALDPTYAKKLGVNTDELIVSQPDTGEQALEIVEALVRSNAIDVLVVDSVAALVPRAEIEGEMGDSHIGLQARLMSQALRKLTAAINKSNCIVIFINQLREKIGIMFGNPETTAGGRALKFYASVRLDIRKIDTIKNGKTTLVGAATGLVVGLVAITPGAGFVPIWSSFIIGALVSPICYFGVGFIKKKLKIDDALDAFGCHGIGGIWGGIATGIFTQKSINPVARWDGLIFGDYHLFVAQIVGIIITIAVAVVGTLICVAIVRVFTPLRVSVREEQVGLDISEHGESAYPSFNGLDQ